MKTATSENSDYIDYCRKMVREHDYPRFLQCAFLPEKEQLKAFSYYALEAELRHIHHHVSEEMIGHIRYAWWREEIEKSGNNLSSKHPVLKALAAVSIDKEIILRLVEKYHEAWPEIPHSSDSAERYEIPPEFCTVDEITKSAFNNNSPWQKAGRKIDNHKARYGEGFLWWLVIKLLF